jgi:hypothetical protein
MKYRVKSQLYADAEAQKKGKDQVLDDCSWSSCAAAVSWASKYTVDYSAAEGVAAFGKATGRVDKQGISDAGGSLAECAKTIAVLGGHARYAKSWQDVIDSAKNGSALIVWVQQPIGYPANLHVSKWHDMWRRYWTKTDPQHVVRGYGHCTSAGYDEIDGWQWACPTRDDKDPNEKFGAQISENDFRTIANSKVKAGAVSADYKAILIVDYKIAVVANDTGARVEAASTPVVAPEPTRGVQPPAASINSFAHAAASRNLMEGDELPKTSSIDPAIEEQLNAFGTADWGKIGDKALHTIEDAVAAAGKERTFMNKFFAVIQYIKTNTQIDEALLEAARVFLATTIAVALATGAPILDMTGADLRTVISGGIAASLNVLVRFLNPNDTQFGVKK